MSRQASKTVAVVPSSAPSLPTLLSMSQTGGVRMGRAGVEKRAWLRAVEWRVSQTARKARGAQ